MQPVYGALAYRRYLRRLENGGPEDRLGLYRQTLVLEWLALAVLGLAWAWLGRPVADLGFSAAGGMGFWIGAGLVALASAALARTWRRVIAMSPEEKREQRDALGRLLHFLPRPGREFRHFCGLSITAGVVEETVYRGFLLWYLVQVLPLWAALLLSSAVFGLGHGYQGIGGAVRTGLAGLAFAGLYVLSGSIWLPMVGHAVLNILQGAMIIELFRHRGGDATLASIDGGKATR